MVIDRDDGCSGWQVDELSCSRLPDERLETVLAKSFDQISAASGNRFRRPAAPTFFVNLRVAEHGMLGGHFAAAAARVRASEEPILVLQGHDRVHPHCARPDRTRVHQGRSKAAATRRGSPTRLDPVRHPSSLHLAVTLVGTTLGLTAVKFWTLAKFRIMDTRM
ncbi:MAG: hypothetical protein E5V16_00385 [Mesorhizobium sp.]|nr:MAG: hypothetical protein E5V16_00385 [Mesorhizobium sp.]